MSFKDENDPAKFDVPSEELQGLLWDQDRTVERIQDSLEARMFGAIRQQFPSTQEIAGDQYRRFEQFVIRFHALIESARSRIGAVFRSSESHNITAIAQSVHDSLQTIQRDIREYVQAASAKGNGPILAAMEAASASLDQPLQLVDLGEEKLLETLIALPGDPELQASTFFTVEKKPQPVIAIDFDANSPSNLWGQITQTTNKERQGNLSPFRWSWSDQELYDKQKAPNLRTLRNSSEAILESWRQMTTELIDEFLSWKERVSSSIPKQKTMAQWKDRKHSTPNKLVINLQEALPKLEAELGKGLAEASQGILERLSTGYWNEQLPEIQEQAITNVLNATGLAWLAENADLPEPTSFVEATVSKFFREQLTSDPRPYPGLDERYVSSERIFHAQRMNIERLSLNRASLEAMTQKGYGLPQHYASLKETIFETLEPDLGSGITRSNNSHALNQAVAVLERQWRECINRLPEHNRFPSLKEQAKFVKSILSQLLTTASSLEVPELSAELTTHCRNAASFFVAWNFRTFVLHQGMLCSADNFPSDYIEEIDNFYPQPSRTEQAKATFRRSWSDDELFSSRKAPAVRILSLSKDQREALWLLTESELFSGFIAWKEDILSRAPRLTRMPRSGDKGAANVETAEVLERVESKFRQVLTEQARPAIQRIYGIAVWKENVDSHEQEISNTLHAVLQAFRDLATGTPDPTFIDTALHHFFDRVTESSPVPYPHLEERHISDEKVLFVGEQENECRVTEDVMRMALQEGYTYIKPLEDAIRDSVASRLAEDASNQNLRHAVYEASKRMQRQVAGVIPEVLQRVRSEFNKRDGNLLFETLDNFVRFWKVVLALALERLNAFSDIDVPPDMLLEMKNAASFYVSWNIRDICQHVALSHDLPATPEYVAELSDFFVELPEHGIGDATDASENVSSGPLTKEALLTEWGLAMDRMIVRIFRRGMLITQNAAIVEIDFEDMRKNGIEIIEKYCAAGPVGKRRVRPLRKELSDAVQLHDKVSARLPKLQKAVQEIMAICGKELQQMFANIDGNGTSEKTEPNTEGATTVSVESLQCQLLSIVHEHRAHRTPEEVQKHKEALSDKEVWQAYDKWYKKVNTTMDEAFQACPVRPTLKQCLTLINILRHELFQPSGFETLAPEFWKMCREENETLYNDMERRVRARFAAEDTAYAEAHGGEVLGGNRERILKEELIGFIASLQEKNVGAFMELDRLIQSSSVAQQISDSSMRHLEQTQAIQKEMAPSLTLEECRECCALLHNIPGVLEGVSNVSEELQRMFANAQRIYDEEIQNGLPHLFERNEQPSDATIEKEQLWTLVSDLLDAGSIERVTYGEFVPTDSKSETARASCGRVLRQLFRELPSRVTQEQCKIFILSARAATLPIEEACQFPASVSNEYKKSFEETAACWARAIDAQFAREKAVVIQPLPTRRKERASPAEKPKAVISQSALTQWWAAVREEAGRRMNISIEASTCTTEQVRNSVLTRVPPLANRADIRSREAYATFMEEMQQRIDQIPDQFTLECAVIRVPNELREFLANQLGTLQEGLSSIGWKVELRKKEAVKKPTSDSSEAGDKSGASVEAQLTDLLTFYDVEPSRVVERLSHAIAEHVAHAAMESMTGGEQIGDAELARRASDLRKCVDCATAKAKTLLEATDPASLTPEQLAAIAGQAFDEALTGAELPAGTVESMQTILAEHRTGFGSATSPETAVEFVMEGGGRGRRGFEERVRMIQQANSDQRMRAHGQRVGRIEEVRTRQTHHIDSLLSTLTQRARDAATEEERQSAATEAERLQTFIQTILSMYTESSTPPPSQE